MLKDLLMFHLGSSKNKKIYESIAKKYKVLSFEVYRLAHGKRATTYIESQILHDLMEMDIVSGINYSR